MLPAGFETAILASKQPQTHALGRAATATGTVNSDEEMHIQEPPDHLTSRTSLRKTSLIAAHMAGQEFGSCNPQNPLRELKCLNHKWDYNTSQ
jgi:hypothetical protein